MTILATTLLAPHFTAGELGGDVAGIPSYVLANLYITARKAEEIRAILGVPIGKVGGYRTPARNAAVGGSDTSSHLDGLAFDGTPSGLSLLHAYRAISSAPTMPAFDQIIFYPWDGHIHFGFGPKMRGEYRISLVEGGGFPLLTEEFIAKLGGASGVTVILLAIVLIVLLIARKGG